MLAADAFMAIFGLHRVLTCEGCVHARPVPSAQDVGIEAPMFPANLYFDLHEADAAEPCGDYQTEYD